MRYPPGVHPQPIAVVLAWAVVLAGELVFARLGMVRPTLEQLLLEGLAIGVLCAAQLRLARAPWQASAWWPGVVAVGVTAAALGPDDQATRLLYALGLGTIGYAVVRLGSRRAEHVALTTAAALAGVLAGRWLVLSRAAEVDKDLFKGVVAVADAGSRLRHEVAGLLPQRAEAGSGPPLVLITVDTLRADDAVTMETWARLTERGAGWPRAVSTSSWTLPAMTSMFTGAPAEVHGAGIRPGGGYQIADPSQPSLTEALDGAGYLTAAFVSNSWLEASMGFGRGFDVFLHSNEAFPHRLLIAGMPKGPIPVDGQAIVDRALGWLRGAPARGWFLWVHLVEPHMPYFNATDPLCMGVRDGSLRKGLLTTADERERLRGCYRDEVAHADRQLVRLLDALEDKGVFSEGLVVFTADHGEEFWDHGGTEHGHSHHAEVVEVALAVAGAGVSSSAASGGGPASVMDVAATLRAAAGLPARGIDLRAGVPADRVATAWGNSYYRVDKSARSGGHAVIVRGEPSPRVLAYDRRADVTEQHPLAAPPLSLRAAAEGIAPPAVRAQTDVNEEALRALGYIE